MRTAMILLAVACTPPQDFTLTTEASFDVDLRANGEPLVFELTVTGGEDAIPDVSDQSWDGEGTIRLATLEPVNHLTMTATNLDDPEDIAEVDFSDEDFLELGRSAFDQCLDQHIVPCTVRYRLELEYDDEFPLEIALDVSARVGLWADVQPAADDAAFDIRLEPVE